MRIRDPQTNDFPSYHTLSFTNEQFLGGSSQLGKRPGESGHHNRIEICSSLIVQVRYLPKTSFFSVVIHLDVTHGWFPQELMVTGLNQVVTATEYKSVSLGLCRIETCWITGCILTCFSQVDTATEYKSVSLGLCRIETCWITVFFALRTHLDIHSWMVSSGAHLNLS